MQISIILARKGTQVHSVAADATLEEATQTLAQHRVGALVVLGAGPGGVAGILSERDIVLALADRGAAALLSRVADVMTTEVITCEPGASVEDLMSTMTERRIRHVPIVEEDKLTGIVSIGDVVKWRLDDLETQNQAMEAYVTQSPTPFVVPEHP